METLQIAQNAHESNWSKKQLDLRHEIITLFTMENNVTYEKLSQFFEVRHSSLSGLSLDDLLITDHIEAVKAYLKTITITYEDTDSIVIERKK